MNVRWDQRLESCLMPALFSVVATQPIPKQVSGFIQFHSGIKGLLNLSTFFFSSFSSRPYAYEYSANDLYSMVPRSHKCSVMGHKRPNFNQSQKRGDFICHNNIFLPKSPGQYIRRFCFAKNILGGQLHFNYETFLNADKLSSEGNNKMDKKTAPEKVEKSQSSLLNRFFQFMTSPTDPSNLAVIRILFGKLVLTNNI